MIDQTRKAVGAEVAYAWFPQGERISLPYWRESEAVRLLGAVTDDGESFYASVADSFNSETTISYLKALREEFGERLHLVWDNATYFIATDVKEFIAESEMCVTYLPTGSPDMNPVEECWRQLKQRLGNRLFDSRREIHEAAWPILEHIEPPKISDYLCPSV